MTLRLRLMAIIGLSFTLLWAVTSVWMYVHVRSEFRDALDERLAASARMVAGLVAQLPETTATKSASPFSVLDVVAKDGVACEVRQANGGVIARTFDSPKGLGATSAGYSTRTINGQQWRSYTFEQNGKRVTTADRVERRLALLRNIVLSTAVPFLVAMVGSLIVLWFGIRKGLAPLESIRQALADRKPDATTPLRATRVPGEIRPLVHTINSLLDRTRGAIERERRFTGDAAHELRTPLTAVKTHIQVARLAEGEEKQRSLESAEVGVQRLQHTLEQLLVLARVEGPFNFGSEDLADGMEIARMALDGIVTEQRQRVHVAYQEHDRKVAVPRTLAVTTVRNLLDNALRYSPQNTPVKLDVSGSATAMAFSVLDEGPGMSAKDQGTAMARFWRHGSGQGSGLGLSIVDAIVKRFGGELELANRPSGGFKAELRLPVAGQDD